MLTRYIGHGGSLLVAQYFNISVIVISFISKLLERCPKLTIVPFSDILTYTELSAYNYLMLRAKVRAEVMPFIGLASWNQGMSY